MGPRVQDPHGPPFSATTFPEGASPVAATEWPRSNILGDPAVGPFQPGNRHLALPATSIISVQAKFDRRQLDKGFPADYELRSIVSDAVKNRLRRLQMVFGVSCRFHNCEERAVVENRTLQPADEFGAVLRLGRFHLLTYELKIIMRSQKTHRAILVHKILSAVGDSSGCRDDAPFQLPMRAIINWVQSLRPFLGIAIEAQSAVEHEVRRGCASFVSVSINQSDSMNIRKMSAKKRAAFPMAKPVARVLLAIGTGGS